MSHLNTAITRNIPPIPVKVFHSALHLITLLVNTLVNLKFRLNSLILTIHPFIPPDEV